MKTKRLGLLWVMFVLLSACSPAPSEGTSPDAAPNEEAQAAETAEKTAGEDDAEADRSEIDLEREELLAKWGAEGLPQPRETDAEAEALLALPPDQQSAEELIRIADEANRAANFVGFIFEEYAAYYRDNYRYEFIQKKVAPFHDEYVELSNRLKRHRNQAFLNLGLKKKQDGEPMAAFFYFRDAFRLSPFTQAEGDHTGIRYLAEMEMKELLGIEDVGTFVYWK